MSSVTATSARDDTITMAPSAILISAGKRGWGGVRHWRFHRTYDELPNQKDAAVFFTTSYLASCHVLTIYGFPRS